MSASPARSGYVSREHSCALGSRRGQSGALSLEQGEFGAWDELSFLRSAFEGAGAEVPVLITTILGLPEAYELSSIITLDFYEESCG